MTVLVCTYTKGKGQPVHGSQTELQNYTDHSHLCNATRVYTRRPYPGSTDPKDKYILMKILYGFQPNPSQGDIELHRIARGDAVPCIVVHLGTHCS